MTIESKVDLMISKLEKIEKRLDDLDFKFERLTTRMDKLETNLKSTCKEIDFLLEEKVNIDCFNQLNEKIKFLVIFKQNFETSLLMRESYEKRLNIIVHGVMKDQDTPWEKRDKTESKFKDFLINGLKIDDPDKIEYVDIHRLPQHSLRKNGKIIHRSIIVKLLTMNDKQQIFQHVKNLKACNAERQLKENESLYIHINEHLPKKFQEQRKLLLPAYKEAKKNKKKRLCGKQ